MQQTKKWWQSTTIWSGVAIVLLAAYNAAVPQFGLPPIPSWLNEFITGLLGGGAIVGRARADAKIGSAPELD